MSIEALKEDIKELVATCQRLGTKVDVLETALENQEHTIREQEKDIVTLKLQMQSLQEAFKFHRDTPPNYDHASR